MSVKRETVTLTGKGRVNLTCFVYSVYEINNEMFSLSRHFMFGESYWINTFYDGRCVLSGGSS
jgi:hypothetical protein